MVVLELMAQISYAGVLLSSLLAAVSEHIKRRTCTHKHTATYTEEEICTVEKQVKICLKCGKKLETTFET